MKPMRKTTILLAAALLTWVGMCLTWYTMTTTYGRLFIGNNLFVCIYPPILLLTSVLRDEEKNTPQKTPRWLTAFLLLAVTFIACNALMTKDNMETWFYPCVFLLAAVCAFVIGCREKRQRVRWTQRPPLQVTAITVLLLNLCCLITLGGFMAALRPYSIAQVQPQNSYFVTRLAEDDEFIARLTGNREQHPLGVYWFSNENEENICIDVKSGQRLTETEPFPF